MLACRVCLAIGHDDPEGWLETVTSRQLALWKAFYQLEPWGADFERSAAQSALLSGQISMMAAGYGQQIESQGLEDFMPSDWANATKKQKPRRKRMSPKRVGAMFASMFPTADKRQIKG